jgi:hypothetical protein
VKGWLASDGEARFASTSLREAARSVGGGAERLGLSRCGNSATQPKKGRGAGECCTAASRLSEGRQRLGRMQDAGAGQEADTFGNGKETRLSFRGWRRPSFV